MLRLVWFLALFLGTAAHAAAPPPPPIVARSWLGGDLTRGQGLGAEKADERMEPASLTKMMAAYLVFGALRDKKLTLEQTVPVSTHAWRAPGSRMVIEPRKTVKVDELIKRMEIQSASDAPMALTEAVAGSEEVFVHLMNWEAERLGLKNTHFTN